MSRDEHVALRKKFEELEREVKRLREPLETTLMDVRELISNLENPFNLASSILEGVEKPEIEKKADGEVQSRKSRYLRENHVSAGDGGKASANGGGYEAGLEGQRGMKVCRERRNELAVIGCAYMLLRILGLDATVKFLNSRAARKFASPELLDMLLDAVEFMVSLNAMADSHGGGGDRKSYEELMVAAAYLVSMLASGADERFFTSLILASKILDLKLRED